MLNEWIRSQDKYRIEDGDNQYNSVRLLRAVSFQIHFWWSERWTPSITQKKNAGNGIMHTKPGIYGKYQADLTSGRQSMHLVPVQRIISMCLLYMREIVLWINMQSVGENLGYKVCKGAKGPKEESWRCCSKTWGLWCYLSSRSYNAESHSDIRSKTAFQGGLQRLHLFFFLNNANGCIQ